MLHTKPIRLAFVFIWMVFFVNNSMNLLVYKNIYNKTLTQVSKIDAHIVVLVTISSLSYFIDLDYMIV